MLHGCVLVCALGDARQSGADVHLLIFALLLCLELCAAIIIVAIRCNGW